jgi:SM-20-related protein
MTEVGQSSEVAAPRSILPPCHVIRDWLEPETVAALLDFAEQHQDQFSPTGVGDDPGAAVNRAVRVSTGLRRIGRFRPLLKARLLELAPGLIAALKLTPFEVSQVELQLVAHGDGAFYVRHIDTQMIRPTEHIRLLSGVYYFHRQPTAFAGGALRLYAIGDDRRFVDIEPVSNTLLVFPSWAPHQVMPVSCPSGRFADSRFAINCWLKGRRSAPSTAR